MDIASIIGLQNIDGGWPYRKGGGSSTEPTVFALLAQAAVKSDPQSVERGMTWLRASQRQDGGWPPRPSVAQSTWMTALAVLLPREAIGTAKYAAAVEWLMGQTGQETSFIYKMRSELLGDMNTASGERTGWPFIPGAAAWVTPTCFSILALEKARHYQPAGRIQQRIEIGRQFLEERICHDGGWNYGSTRVLGVDTTSYPETTGQALLALNRLQSPALSKTLAMAQEQARRCQSAEGLSWLRLGLQAHGIVAQGPERQLPCRYLVDSALCLLAQAALDGTNVFLG